MLEIDRKKFGTFAALLRKEKGADAEGAGFGLYFCVFTREKAAKVLCENRISAFSDGFLRLNITGVYFNNRNWPYVVRCGQLWAMVGLVVAPAVFFVMKTFFSAFWDIAAVYVILILILGGLFVPMFIVARKYEYAPEDPRPAQVSWRDWIWIGASVTAIPVLIFVLRGGLTFHSSGLQSSGESTPTVNRPRSTRRWSPHPAASAWSLPILIITSYMSRRILKHRPLRSHCKAPLRRG